MFPRCLLLLLAGLVAVPGIQAIAATPETDSVGRAVAFIRVTQQADGGFGGFGPGQSVDAILALRSARVDPAAVLASSGESPVAFLQSAAAASPDAATAAKFALGAVALGLDPRNVGGIDLVARAKAAADPATGRYAPGNDFAEAVAIIGLECTGHDADPRAVAALAGAQATDGGWGFGPDNASIAIQALLAAGVSAGDPAIVRGIAYLRSTQLGDSGWGFDQSGSDASTTAVVIQGLIAAGEDPGAGPYQSAGRSPVDVLLASQRSDGSFPGFDPAFATNLAVPALAGRTYCNAASTPILPQPSVPTPGPQPTPAPPRAGVGTAERSRVEPWIILVGLLLTALGASALAAPRRR